MSLTQFKCCRRWECCIVCSSFSVVTAASAPHPWDGKGDAFKQVWHFRSELQNNCKLIMMLTFCCQGRGFLFLQKPPLFALVLCLPLGAPRAGEALGDRILAPCAPKCCLKAKQGGSRRNSASPEQHLGLVLALSRAWKCQELFGGCPWQGSDTPGPLWALVSLWKEGLQVRVKAAPLSFLGWKS